MTHHKETDVVREDLSKVEQSTLLSRLQNNFGVPEELVREISVRLNDGRYQQCMREQAERRVEYLEQHVAPEILNPPAVETRRVPRWTGD